jgi:hypothetical protein
VKTAGPNSVELFVLESARPDDVKHIRADKLKVAKSMKNMLDQFPVNSERIIYGAQTAGNSCPFALLTKPGPSIWLFALSRAFSNAYVFSEVAKFDIPISVNSHANAATALSPAFAMLTLKVPIFKEKPKLPRKFCLKWQPLTHSGNLQNVNSRRLSWRLP